MSKTYLNMLLKNIILIDFLSDYKKFIINLKIKVFLVSIHTFGFQ